MHTEFKWQTHPILPQPWWCLIDILVYWNVSLFQKLPSLSLTDIDKKTDTAIHFVNSKRVWFVWLLLRLPLNRILYQHCSPYAVGAQRAVAVASSASSGLRSDLIQPGPSVSEGSVASVGPVLPMSAPHPDPVVRPGCSWLDDCSGVSWKLLDFRLSCFSFCLRWGLTVQPC